jgi:hypothetical protein
MTYNPAISGELHRAAVAVLTPLEVDRKVSFPTLACTSPGHSPGRIAERLAGSFPLNDPAFLFPLRRALQAGNGRALPIRRERFVG